MSACFKALKLLGNVKLWYGLLTDNLMLPDCETSINVTDSKLCTVRAIRISVGSVQMF